MNGLFEPGDILDKPVECFVFDASKETFPVKPHWHYFMELIRIDSGRAEMSADGKSRVLSEGDMILFHPKTIHSVYAADGKLPVYSVLKFDINLMRLTPNYAPKMRSIFGSAQKNRMNIFFPAKSTAAQRAGEVFSCCIEEANGGGYGSDLIIKTEIYRLLVEIIREWKSAGFLVDSGVFAEDERYDIYSITEYIDKNMNSGIKVTDIAKKCGISYSHFAKHFPEIYGKTCKQYIDEMRIYKAEEFLVFTDFDLNYISQETGFSDCSHMIKSFRKLRGVTPKQFRLAHTKGEKC